jgi:hypothetical protein
MKFLALLLWIHLACAEKIYDCFLFFNELELLEIRLNELYDHVDHFVLVEATESFRGRPKPLYYRDHQERFRKYANKIIHVILDEPLITEDLWAREAFQRNQILRGLKRCRLNDLILISDLDELIRGEDVQRLVAPLRDEIALAVSANQRFYRMYLNRRHRFTPFWIGTVATTFEHLRRMSPEALRRNRANFPLVDDVGWHFTGVGGLKRFIEKIENFAHAPTEDTPENKDPQKIFEGLDGHLVIEPLSPSFPKFILEHQEELLEQGLLDYPGNSIYK